MFPLRSAMRQRLSPPRRSFRPRVEELEERCVLATFLVNSASLTERVIANPTVTLASSPNPSLLGQPVVFTVSVAAPAAGLPVPTGTVILTSGGSTLGSGTLSGGSITFTTAALPLGQDTVTASYGGDAGYNPASASLAQQVHTNPTMTLVSSQNPSALGRPVVFAAGVAAPVIGLPVPTGTVTFSSGGSTLGSAPLSGGTATFTTAALPLGQDTVTASYGGDANYNPASSSLVERVLPTSGPGVFDPNTGTWFLRNETSAGAPDAGAFAYGAPGWSPVVGDWDGNGTTTVGVVDPTATWYLRNSNTPGAPDTTPFAYGAPGWVPVVGDWNGTGHTGIGTYDPGTGTWYLRNEDGPGLADAGAFRFGGPGWIPVVGDWDGDGKTTVGVVDPATGTWHLRNSNSAGPADSAFPFGLPGWTPVAGDWNGTGHAGVGMFDPTTATWHLRNEANAGPADAAAPFAYGGTTTPIPLPPQGGFTAPFAPAVLSFTPAWKPFGGTWVGAHPGGQGLTLLADGGPGTAAAGRMDLLTAVLHEMGHLAGRPDPGARAHPGDLMADTLDPGARRTDALDQVFAGGTL